MANVDEQGIDLEGMREYLTGTPVVFALLFGSYARDTAESSSDVDVAVKFPDAWDDRERFRARNRIDATLQQFADDFVDVSDVDSLPTDVAHAALQDGKVLVGDDETVATYREQLADAYEETATERERERREFLDRLARGDA